MAKYDQVLLKFLNQNSDRAPTLIDMMTKLKISISDLTDSLADLLAQGAIAKQSNEQGMETWSVASKTATPQVIPTETISKPTPTPVVEAPAVKLEAEPTPVPLPLTEVPSPAPVAQVPNTVEAAPTPTPNYSTAPYFPAPVSKGIGIFTLAMGLVLTAALSIWVGSRLAQNRIEAVSKDFVNQKMFSDIGNAFLVFEDKSKADMAALKVQVKELQSQLTTVQGLTDSLQLALAASVAEKANAKTKKVKTSRRR